MANRFETIVIPKWYCDYNLPPSLKMIEEVSGYKNLKRKDIVSTKEFNYTWHIRVMPDGLKRKQG